MSDIKNTPFGAVDLCKQDIVAKELAARGEVLMSRAMERMKEPKANIVEKSTVLDDKTKEKLKCWSKKMINDTLPANKKSKDILKNAASGIGAAAAAGGGIRNGKI